jgi:hypothetical protein
MARAVSRSSTHNPRAKGERAIDLIIRAAERDFAPDWRRFCVLAQVFAPDQKTAEDSARERIGVQYGYDIAAFRSDNRQELYESTELARQFIKHFVDAELANYTVYGFMGPDKFLIDRPIRADMFRLSTDQLHVDADTIYRDVYLIKAKGVADTPAVKVEITAAPPLEIRSKQVRKKPARSRDIEQYDRNVARDNCAKYLADLFRTSPMRRTHSSRDLWQTCRRRFKGLTWRDYRAAREAALKQVPEAKTAWTRGGRR